MSLNQETCSLSLSKSTPYDPELCSWATEQDCVVHIPTGSRASVGTGIERQLPGTRMTQSVQGTCLSAWGQCEREGCGTDFSSSLELPRDAG